MSRRTPAYASFVQKFTGDPLAVAGLAVLVALVVASLLAPVLPVGRPDQIGFGPRLSPPSLDHLIGTDQLGRSVSARLLQGIRNTLLLSTIAVLFSGMVGAIVAMMASYHSRVADEASIRFADVLFSFPPILLGILVVSVIGPGMLSSMAIISLVTFPTMLRVVRAAVLGVIKRDFVVFSEIAGVSFPRRIVRHILPNVATVIAIQMVYSISFGMVLESAMSFLGIGVQAPVASLGTILRDGLPYLVPAPWLVMGAGAVLSLAILSVNLVGDGLTRLIDPLAGR